jgi:hypothetical protein
MYNIFNEIIFTGRVLSNRTIKIFHEITTLS